MNYDIGIIVIFVGLIVGGLTAIIGMWIERDRRRPPTWITGLTVLIGMATLVSLYQAWEESKESEKLQNDMARMLLKLDEVAAKAGDQSGDLAEFLKTEMASQNRANPRVLNRMSEQVTQQGGDAVAMLSRHLPPDQVGNLNAASNRKSAASGKNETILRSQNEKLKSEVEKLKKAVAQANKSRDDAQTRLAKLDERISKFEQDIRESTKAVAESNDAKIDLEKQVQKLTLELTQAKEVAESVARERDAAKSEADSIRKALAGSKELATQFTSKQEDVVGRISEQEKKVTTQISTTEKTVAGRIEKLEKQLTSKVSELEGQVEKTLLAAKEAGARQKDVLQAIEDARGEVEKLDSVGFSRGETVAAESQDRVLKLVQRIIRDRPAAKIQLVGHSCDLGTPETILQASWDRAANLREFLVNSGIDQQILTIMAAGDAYPMAPNESEEQRRKNRRVEIFVVNE